MARPLKKGIDYFPLEVDIDKDDKILLVESIYGLEGYAVVIKFFNKIYGTDGYFYNWTEVEKILMSRQLQIKKEKLEKMINDFIEFGIFDKGMYKKYSILTSKGIQERFFFITSRRKNTNVENSFLLVNCEEFRGVEKNKKVDKSVENSINVNNNPNSMGVIVNNNPNSSAVTVSNKYTKESKVNDLKIKDKGQNANFEEYHPLLELLVENDYIDAKTPTKQIKQFHDLFIYFEKEYDLKLIEAATSYITRFVKRNNVAVRSKVAYLETGLRGNLEWLSRDPEIYKSDEEYYESIYNKLSALTES